jgi:hypothetical protein
MLRIATLGEDDEARTTLVTFAYQILKVSNDLVQTISPIKSRNARNSTMY